MRAQHAISIATIGNYNIDAKYSLRYDLEKEVPEVEEIQLHVRKLQVSGSYEVVKTIRLLDIPGWMWELLTDYSTISKFKRESLSERIET